MHLLKTRLILYRSYKMRLSLVGSDICSRHIIDVTYNLHKTDRQEHSLCECL